MFKVGIIGAGIGGSYLAYLLSRRGMDTVAFDSRAPHEKLCGGVPHEAMDGFLSFKVFRVLGTRSGRWSLSPRMAGRLL